MTDFDSDAAGAKPADCGQKSFKTLAVLGSMVLSASMLIMLVANLDSPINNVEFRLHINHYDHLTGQMLVEEVDVNTTAVWKEGDGYRFEQITKDTFDYRVNKGQNHTVMIMLSSVPDKNYVMHFGMLTKNATQFAYQDLDGDGKKEVLLQIKPEGELFRLVKLTGIRPAITLDLKWINESAIFGLDEHVSSLHGQTTS